GPSRSRPWESGPWSSDPWSERPPWDDVPGNRAREPWGARSGVGGGAVGAGARSAGGGGTRSRTRAGAGPETGSAPRPGVSFHPGQKVRHPKWGEGTVIACEPSGDDAMVTVAFEGQGVKKLM